MDKENFKLFLLLSLLAAFPPLSTDLYLPALPLLQETWAERPTTINLTLSAFFIGYCASLLFYGPLSDRFGRRPPLLAGILIYVIACALCAFSDNVNSMIVYRFFQGVGSAAASVIAFAITKDVYEGNERQKILAYMGVIMALAPMLAPVLGGWIMTWLTWPWIFISQAVIGSIAWFGVLRLDEPMKKLSADSLYSSMKSYLELVQNKKYMTMVLLFSMISLAHFSFIGSAADIYINRFGTSEQVFGYFFAANAMAIMAGSFSCARLQKILDARRLLTVSFSGLLVAGIVMYLQLFRGPFSLTIPMALASFSFGLSRPPSNNLILEQVDKGVGAASSLMVFVYFLIAAFSMWAISFDWQDKITVISFLAMTSGGVLVTVWLLFPTLSQGKSFNIDHGGLSKNKS